MTEEKKMTTEGDKKITTEEKKDDTNLNNSNVNESKYIDPECYNEDLEEVIY